MNEQLLIKNIAEIGKLLLKNGAEIYRVEESLERMCQSYGFQDIGVFALPTYFTMSVTFQDGTSTSLTKRTLQNRTNLDAVCALNDLVRKICNETPTNDFIEQQMGHQKGRQCTGQRRGSYRGRRHGCACHRERHGNTITAPSVP